MMIRLPLYLLWAGLLGASVLVDTFAASVGIVQNERVRVRAQATIYSEILGKLNTGDEINIVREITLESPRPGEPPDWLMIVMPQQAEVWVSEEHLDLSTGQVTASRLNVRAGRGTNYSIVGQLEKGTVVEINRTLSGWASIKPQSETFAYIAAQFVERVESVTQDPLVPADLSLESDVVSNRDPSIIGNALEAPVSRSDRIEEAKPVTIAEPGAPRAVNSSANESGRGSTFDRAVAQVNASASEGPNPPVEPGDLSEALPRIITREGIVKTAMSIQAPTKHRLEDPLTGKTINYLYTGNLLIEPGNRPLNLKPFVGYKIRVVGQESLDKRWPKIPVIEIEQLRMVE